MKTQRTAMSRVSAACALVAMLFSSMTATADDHASAWPERFTSLGVEYNYTLIAEGRKQADDENLEDFHGYGLQLGHQFSPAVSAYIQAAMGDSESTNTDADLDIESYSIGVRAHPMSVHQGEWRLFFGGGYRYNNYAIDFAAPASDRDVSENLLFAETGLQKLMFNQRILAEAGVRALGEVEDTYLDFQPFIGVSVLFGRQYPEAPAPIVLDSDNDGVFDDQDRCPNTPTGDEVDAQGCTEKDSDNDGVLDKNDACPDTPAGAKVDASGCAEKLKVEVRENLYIAFPTNSATVPESSIADLENIARLMKTYPTTELQVMGHTDSVGSATYNMKLSEARASAVRKVLAEEYNLSLNRIMSQGMGETAPIADNSTAEGRAQNRRVELVLRQPE